MTLKTKTPPTRIYIRPFFSAATMCTNPRATDNNNSGPSSRHAADSTASTSPSHTQKETMGGENGHSEKRAALMRAITPEEMKYLSGFKDQLIADLDRQLFSTVSVRFSRAYTANCVKGGSQEFKTAFFHKHAQDTKEFWSWMLLGAGAAAKKEFLTGLPIHNRRVRIRHLKQQLLKEPYDDEMQNFWILVLADYGANRKTLFKAQFKEKYLRAFKKQLPEELLQEWVAGIWNNEPPPMVTTRPSMRVTLVLLFPEFFAHISTLLPSIAPLL